MLPKTNATCRFLADPPVLAPKAGAAAWEPKAGDEVAPKAGVEAAPNPKLGAELGAPNAGDEVAPKAGCGA